MSKLKNLLHIIGARVAQATAAIKQKIGRTREIHDEGQQSTLSESAPSPLPILGRFKETAQYRAVIAISLALLILATGSAYLGTELDSRAQEIRVQLDDIAQIVQQLRGEVQGAAAGNTDAATDIDDHYIDLLQKVANLSAHSSLREIRVKSLPEAEVEPRWSDQIWGLVVGDSLDLAPRLEGVLGTLDEFSKTVAVSPQFGALTMMAREMVKTTQVAAGVAKTSMTAKDGLSASLGVSVIDVHERAKDFAGNGGNTVDLAELRRAINLADGRLQSSGSSPDKERIQTIFAEKVVPLAGVLDTTFRRISQDLGLEFSRASDNAAKATAEVSKPLPTLAGVVFVWSMAGTLFIAGLAGVAVLVAINAKASQFAAYYAKRERDETDQRVLAMMHELRPVAEGDLTRSLTVTDHVTGSIADRVNVTMGHVRNVMDLLKRSTRDVEQSIEDVFLQTSEATQLTERANSQAAAAQKASEAGAEAVTLAVQRANKQRGQIQDVSKGVKRLGEVFQSVSHVSDVIENITAVMEVLALNTQIQASSAGEDAAGFRVIAAEQQRLTDDTKKALENIKGMMQSVLAETQTVIQTVEGVTADMVESSVLWDEAGRSLKTIREASGMLAALISEVEQTAQGNNRAASSAVSSMGKLNESASHFKTDEETEEAVA